MAGLISESAQEVEAAGLARRLAWRCIILEVIGISLVATGLMVSWPPPDDPSLPPTRPFLVFVGLLICAAGLALRFRPAYHEDTHSKRDH